MDNQYRTKPRFRPNPGLKLMSQVREVPRYYHAHRVLVCGLDRTVVRSHGRRPPNGPFPAEPKIEAFLTDLAVRGNITTATQNLAMHALVFLDTRVLHQALPGRINAVRADQKLNVPVVMTRETVAAVTSPLYGTAHLDATLRYGSGLRIMESVRLRGAVVYA
jgi:hypothetical protein